jgi:hypothetical protein
MAWCYVVRWLLRLRVKRETLIGRRPVLDDSARWDETIFAICSHGTSQDYYGCRRRST